MGTPMKTAILYQPDGSEVEVMPTNGRTFTLNEFQMMVSGFVEILPLPNKYFMAVNEEGQLEGLPVNPKATEIWNQPPDVIVGPALVFPGKML